MSAMYDPLEGPYYDALWWDPETGAEKYNVKDTNCNGLCLYGADVGVPEYGGIAYPHPLCVLHGGHDPWVEDHTDNEAACHTAQDRLTTAYFEGWLMEERQPT